MPGSRTVVFVLYDGFQLVDFAGPVEVLHGANTLGADPPYCCVFASPGGRPVRTFSGVEITAHTDLAELAAADSAPDTVLVVGGVGATHIARDEQFRTQLSTLARRSQRVASVCTGALVLAAAGLLHGQRATTHWAYCADMARDHPDVTVRPDRIYVEDGRVWTSAGVTAGIDLALALVERDHGPDVAHTIARAIGLNSPETLHRLISRRLHTTPDRYRQHFAARAS